MTIGRLHVFFRELPVHFLGPFQGFSGSRLTSKSVVSTTEGTHHLFLISAANNFHQCGSRILILFMMSLVTQLCVCVCFFFLFCSFISGTQIYPIFPSFVIHFFVVPA